MTTSKPNLKTLLTLDPTALDEKTLLQARTDLNRSINTNPKHKQEIIEKCRQLSTVLKLKFPKQKLMVTPQQQAKKYELVTVECDQCGDQMYHKTTTKNPLAYCQKCRRFREHDLVEIVTVDGATVYTEKHLTDAEAVLGAIEAPLRLDLHGVADLLPVTIIPKQDTIVVSYVGKLTRTRSGARAEMVARVKSGQIVAGVLVFLRGKRGTDEENACHRAGSKAWVNAKLKPSQQMHFVDDSSDHYESVKSLNLDGLQSTLLSKGDAETLLKLL